jgi:hypothetical protein
LSTEGEHSPFEIFLYPDELDASEGLTADAISAALSGLGGLPGDTLISVSPNGLSFQGSEDPVHAKFTVALRPDTSFSLSDFIDLSLTSWEVTVDPTFWPGIFAPSAEDVHQGILAGIRQATSPVNAAILNKIEKIIHEEEGVIPWQVVKTFIESTVSVTFTRIRYPNQFAWRLDDTNDPRVAVVADPCIGYPRAFA